jgi:hypothetical protein
VSVETGVPTTSEGDDTVPVNPRHVADRGYLDKPGRLRAGVDSWYPRHSRGALGHDALRHSSARLEPFQQAATRAVAEAVAYPTTVIRAGTRQSSGVGSDSPMTTVVYLWVTTAGVGRWPVALTRWETTAPA